MYWNGKDDTGDNIANGAYFYSLRARSESGLEFESIEKLAKIK